MRLLGNLIWVLFGGLISSFLWLISGLLLCLTIVFIPFGIQCFKIAGFVLFPFGKEIDIGNFGFGGFILNILWILFLGWELFIMHLILSGIFFITVIGIPFGIQHLKLAKLSFLPFGSKIH